MYHISVLLSESIDLLAIKADGVYVDVTFGGGGHTKEILRRLGKNGKVFAFDRDAEARENQIDDERLTIIPTDFKFIDSELAKRGIRNVDGILADLGVSSHQFDTAERGFSFRFDAPLDMRMDTSQALTAATILNEYEATDLQTMFSRYGEVINSKTLAQTIVNQRKIEKITGTFQFEQKITACILKKERNKYLAQVYQALRIEVNQELASLEALLLASENLLEKGGRISIIAYHSLEDRMVKHIFRTGNLADKVEKDFYGNVLTPWKLITKKAIAPSESEIENNPRARSAKLRAAEKQ
jgi:16S rRNA (cytosine1402-N4)-methyltransferase